MVYELWAGAASTPKAKEAIDQLRCRWPRALAYTVEFPPQAVLPVDYTIDTTKYPDTGEADLEQIALKETGPFLRCALLHFDGPTRNKAALVELPVLNA
jgi:hypothetical protein